MNNLEKMKQNIISQIQAMDIAKFEQLIDLIDDDIFDMSELFTCEKCRKRYGSCTPNGDCSVEVCSERFERYACSDEL